ncbi:MAG: phosphatase PAP2 family protein [Bacteroidetes bacterium]|nr:phosphatase PAP2 family protein [Bacteroidota bacterium]
MAGWPNNWNPRSIWVFGMCAKLGLGLLLALILVYGNGRLFTLLYDGGAHYVWAFPLTHLGDSLILCTLLAWALPRRHFPWLVSALLLVALSGLVAQALKHGFFDSWTRPAVHYAHQYAFPANTPTVNSFPSGHSTSLFTVATCLLMVVRSRVGQALLAGAALCLALTRIWVGAHFPLDVVAGGFLGLSLSYFLGPLLLRLAAPLGNWPAASVLHSVFRWAGLLLALGQWANLYWGLFS